MHRNPCRSSQVSYRLRQSKGTSHTALRRKSLVCTPNNTFLASTLYGHEQSASCSSDTPQIQGWGEATVDLDDYVQLDFTFILLLDQFIGEIMYKRRIWLCVWLCGDVSHHTKLTSIRASYTSEWHYYLMILSDYNGDLGVDNPD
jgi:hypothetical protein